MSPQKPTLPHTSTSSPLPQFLFLPQSRQHVCPQPGTAVRCLHLYLLTRAAWPTSAVPYREEMRYSSEVLDGISVPHAHWGAGSSPSLVWLYLEHTIISLCLARNYHCSFSLLTAPEACHLLPWLSPMSCQQGRITKTLPTSTCELLTE